jgi:hypothetical protein
MLAGMGTVSDFDATAAAVTAASARAFQAGVAAAVGAAAVGALAVGAVAIGRVVVGKAVLRQLEAGEVRIRSLSVDEFRIGGREFRPD